MQVRIDPIVNRSFRLETQNSKINLYVQNLVKVRASPGLIITSIFMAIGFLIPRVLDSAIIYYKFEFLYINLNYEMSQKIRRKKLNPLEKFN